MTCAHPDNRIYTLPVTAINRPAGARRFQWRLGALVRNYEGLLVFPLHWATAVGLCSCGDRGCTRVAKHPLTEHGLKDATDDPRRIDEYWDRWPHANIGLTCRADRPIAWLDVDPHKGGLATWTGLTARLGIFRAVQQTITTCTGGAGAHYWGRPSRPLRNSVAQLGPGVDVRSVGGYVVAPPSTHTSGRFYRFLRGRSPFDVVVMPMPPALEEAIVRLEHKSVPHAACSYRVTADVSEIESALAYINADNRDIWLRIGMALHRDGGSGARAIWDQWSQTSAKFNAHDQELTWRHFRVDGAVGLGTLFRLALDAGWRGRRRAS